VQLAEHIVFVREAFIYSPSRLIV